MADTGDDHVSVGADTNTQTEDVVTSGEAQNEAADVVLPEADFSGDEEEGEPEVGEASEGADAPEVEVNKQEEEEMEMMAQAASASLEEHLLAEQQQQDTADDFQHQQPADDFNHNDIPDNNDLQKPVASAGGSNNQGGHTNNGRFPCLTPNKAQIPRLPSPRGGRGQHLRHPQMMTSSRLQMMTRTNNPTKAPCRVGMSARAKVSTSHPSNYVFNPRRPRKVIGWDAAMSARPPLRIDMEGPTPCSYSPATKPLYETNSPKWTLGGKTFVEKGGIGSRTSWEKTWFQSPDVWTQKADFFSDRRWPPPSQYQKAAAMGPHHAVAKAGHAHSIGSRRSMTINRKGSEGEPAPCDYNRETSDLVTRTKAPAYTHSLRRGGTLLWSVGESLENPGPGTYTPRTSYVKNHCPAFSIQGVRREKSHVLGPYAAF